MKHPSIRELFDHWEERRAAMEGKAMIVTMSRDIAARLYEQIRGLRPAWHDPEDERGSMKVVVTGRFILLPLGSVMVSFTETV